MTIFELAIFVGLPGCLAYCFTFPLKGAFNFAFAIGVGSAVVAALIVFLSGAVFRAFKHRWPASAVFPAWSSIAFALVALAGSFAIQHSHLALLGVPASFAAFVAVIGPKSWCKVSWACFATVIMACVALRIFIL